jgi:ATP-dependent Clp protease ATP-binding subunit ClpX
MISNGSVSLAIANFDSLVSSGSMICGTPDDAIEAIAQAAIGRKIGARGLRMIIEDLMLEIMYSLPGQKKIRECVITREVVESKALPITLMEKAG